MKRALVLLALVLALAVLLALELPQRLSLDTFKASLASLLAWREAAPAQAALVYFAAYVALAALSVPGAAVATLAAGALFGFGPGLVLVSFASSLGALLAFLSARHLLRDAVHARFGPRLSAIEDGVRRDGAFYLFALRLVPLFPFVLINLLMGLTPLRAWTFYWVSQLGMLAGTAVYVNAGTQLARVDSLADVGSPALWGSFVLLGLFPLLARAALRALRRRRVCAPWRRPRRFDRNLVVIGAGAAGLVTAYIAAAVKARVTLVESHRMGGDCLNTGCVPSKALIRSARLAHQMRHADRWGLRPTEPRVDFAAVMARVRQVIGAIEPHDSVERYAALGVDVVAGHARLVDPWTVAITAADGSERRLTTRAVVIATGAEPVLPALPGLPDVTHATSETLWDHLLGLDAVPARVVVLGGGPIGCELAQALARLGSQVSLVEQQNRLLGSEDDDVAQAVTEALRADGVTVITGATARRCGHEGARQWLRVDEGNTPRELGFDLLLCAVGRRARLSGFGLEALGLPTDRTVVTNEYLETLYPHIYAAGDVAGPWQFTHTAAHQAWYAAVNALFAPLRRFKVDTRVIPRAVFTDPEVARVGLSETEALALGQPFEVTRFELAELDRAIVDGAAHGFVKVLTAPGSDHILGATLVGEHAAELLAEFVLAMKHGLGLNRLLGTIHVYPTWAEANKYVAGGWKRAHAPQRVLGWLEHWHRWRRGGTP